MLHKYNNVDKVSTILKIQAIMIIAWGKAMNLNGKGELQLGIFSLWISILFWGLAQDKAASYLSSVKIP